MHSVQEVWTGGVVCLSFHLSPNTYGRATSSNTMHYFPLTLLLEFFLMVPTGAPSLWKAPKHSMDHMLYKAILPTTVIFLCPSCRWQRSPCACSLRLVLDSSPVLPLSPLAGYPPQSSPLHPPFQHRAQSFAASHLNRSDRLLTSLPTSSQGCPQMVPTASKNLLKSVLFH